MSCAQNLRGYTRYMEILSKLLGGPARVKIMRLFLLNPSRGFDAQEVSDRSKVPLKAARREINALSKIDFVKQKDFIKEEVIRGSRTKKPTIKKRKVHGWFLDPAFPYLEQLKALLIDPDFLKKEDIIARFKGVGRVKLLVASGIFIQDDESRVDLLLVGDNLKRTTIESTIRMLESEIGKELSYAIFETKEFIYRLSMYDKLVRDILDYPHEKLIDSREFSTLMLKKA